MAAKPLIPLSTQVEIVDKDGKPTPQFCRVLQKLAIGTSLTQTASGTLDIASIAAKTILANKTAGSAAPTSCTISDIMDFLSGTPAQGDIVYRNATSWVRLPAGTAGQVLTTGGAGANPSWAAAGGGGGASYEGTGNLLSLAGLTKLAGASANITLTDGTKAHKYQWTASGSNTIQMAYTSAPGSTPWNVYLRFNAFEQFGVNTDFGLAVRNSTSGKISLFMLFGNGGKGIGVQDWTNATTFSTSVFTSATVDSTSPTWLRINNDGTNLNYYWSSNGVDWYLLATRTLAVFMGSVDQVGVGGVPQIAGKVLVSNFGFTTPA